MHSIMGSPSEGAKSKTACRSGVGPSRSVVVGRSTPGTKVRTGGADVGREDGCFEVGSRLLRAADGAR
jgi:hypothetical protein